jgi:phospholipid/cholesterol/gamma-HCH transport system substrate-binding protein
MPSQQEVKWSQLKVGVIVTISTLLLCTLLFLMTSSTGMGVFSKKILLTTYFANSGGLKDGAAVDLEGVTIGQVTHVVVVNDPARKLTPVKVMMKIDPRYHTSLHKDSLATLSTVGVLGDTVVDIDSKRATGPELQDGDELHTRSGAGISDVVETSQKTLESMTTTLQKLDGVIDTIQKGQGSVGKFIVDPELYNQANATVAELHKLTANLNAGKGSIGKLMASDELYDHLNASAANLDKITSQLGNGKGSAGKLLTDESLYNNLNATLVHTNSLLAEADAGKGTLGILIKDPSFANKLTDTVDKLDTLLGGVNSGKGTLGKLATDDAAYTNLNKLLSSSTDLVTTIRSDPKKYLTIHLKIF